jgi:hypothetical protein
MGAYLSEPNLTKSSADSDNEKISYGASSMQGWRITQEVIFYDFILSLLFLVKILF